MSLAKQLKESQHSISSNNTLEQIILTKTDESIVVMNTTKIEESEIIFVLAAALIGYSRRLGLNEVILNESMSYLWKDTRFNHIL
ncbi:hypothetical protein [Enterococcus faecalis]|uniref:hypothetical protein n=1 Tax=Enterococcus faecalis TaxID=1351 RepID=UPI003EC07B36